MSRDRLQYVISKLRTALEKIDSEKAMRENCLREFDSISQYNSRLRALLRFLVFIIITSTNFFVLLALSKEFAGGDVEIFLGFPVISTFSIFHFLFFYTLDIEIVTDAHVLMVIPVFFYAYIATIGLADLLLYGVLAVGFSEGWETLFLFMFSLVPFIYLFLLTFLICLYLFPSSFSKKL